VRLPARFYRLPVRFDVPRLAAEVAQFSEAEWRRHPSGFSGNSAIRLISVGGGENDDTGGEMLPTPQLLRCPYIMQVLASFSVVWSRARLMRLAPGAVVPEHCDVNYQWFHRVRLHIPVRTHPAVSFRCAEQTVHMAAGEAWLFDNWHLHEVRNDGPEQRVHLVADTTGTAAFWQMAHRSQSSGFEQPAPPARLLPYVAGQRPPLYTERYNLDIVMPPAEVEQLAQDLLRELLPEQSAEDPAELAAFAGLVRGFCSDWRSLWSSFGNSLEGWPHYARLRDQLDEAIDRFPSTAIVCASNGVPAKRVLRDRVLHHAFKPPSAPRRTPALDREYDVRSGAAVRFDRPLFIVAAPRSGSTLLFETLAQSGTLSTVGDETHLLIEGLERLRPGAPGIDSNRLTAQQADAAAREHILGELQAQLRDCDGHPVADGAAVRLLEKTPKNALRIPFFDALFPDARFVFLWRDPRDNISSIMEAWKSGRWVTYPQLEGWDGPWSLLLTPGWQELKGRSLEEIAAQQWRRTNETVLEDLGALAPQRWMSLSYEAFLRQPADAVRAICEFAQIPYDERLARRCKDPLPLSAYTNTPPAADKWRRNEAQINRVLPQIEPVWQRLRQLGR